MIRETLDLFCDECAQWTHFPGRGRAILRAAKRDGWSRHKTADGTMADLCPQCAGRNKHYWWELEHGSTYPVRPAPEKTQIAGSTESQKE